MKEYCIGRCKDTSTVIQMWSIGRARSPSPWATESMSKEFITKHLSVLQRGLHGAAPSAWEAANVNVRDAVAVPAAQAIAASSTRRKVKIL